MSKRKARDAGSEDSTMTGYRFPMVVLYRVDGEYRLIRVSETEEPGVLSFEESVTLRYGDVLIRGTFVPDGTQ